MISYAHNLKWGINMEYRYSWQNVLEDYSKKTFNLEDAKHQRYWFIRDKKTDDLHRIPKEYIYYDTNGKWEPSEKIKKELNNYEFYIFIKETCPEYYKHITKHLKAESLVVESRYSWQNVPPYYSGKTYNIEDAKFLRKWLIRDKKTDKLYQFPKEYIYSYTNGKWEPSANIAKELNNQEFYYFICATVPDFDQFPIEFVDEILLDIWVRTTSSPIRTTIKEEWLNENQKQILDNRFKDLKATTLSKHL